MYAPVTNSDIPAVVHLMNRAYHRSDSSPGWSTKEAYLAGDRTTEMLLRDDLSAKPLASLLKWESDQADGMSGCVWLEPASEDTWYLGSFAIDPERQNGGLGRIMLAAAEDWVRQRGAKRVRMTAINVREILIGWYLRRGYSRTGAIEPFPYGDTRFGEPLRADLCFVVLEKMF